MLKTKLTPTTFFKFRRNDFPTDTALTYDTWSKYRTMSYYSKVTAISQYDEMKSEEEFSRIELCEEITRNFFKIPDESRCSIIRLAEFDLSHAEIIAYTNILHRMKRVYPKVKVNNLIFSIYDGHKGYSPRISSSFVAASFKFMNFQERTSNRPLWTWGKASRTLLNLLIPIYGEQKIIDAINLWIENVPANDHLDDFIVLLERFDDLDSNYPFSWMLGILTSDICTKLQMSESKG